MMQKDDSLPTHSVAGLIVVGMVYARSLQIPGEHLYCGKVKINNLLESFDKY